MKISCQHCGEQTGNPKFCSRSCSAKVNNVLHQKRLKVENLCLVCGEETGRAGRGFCSRTHFNQRRLSLVIDRFLSGADMSGSDGHLSSPVRKYLLEEAGNLCTRCGWGEVNPVLGYPILTIDHIDGNWKHNTKENLVVLCYNCHSLTETFGILNRGSISGRNA